MPNRALRCLAAVLLGVFCLAFARSDTAAKSMVRALLLEPGPSGWTVGLLYQAPEGSADSAEASDGIRFAAAQGSSLERAMQNAESALPLDPNYRLCDHLLLMPGGGWDALRSYEALVLERRCGRTSALVAACTFTCAQLSEETEEGGSLLTGLLQTLKQARKASPRLYEAGSRGALLLPVLDLGEGGAVLLPEGLFLSEQEQALWEAEPTAAYRLLTGRGESFAFWLGERPLILRRPLLSVERTEEGSFAVRLDCQTGPGSAAPTREMLDRLGSVCSRLLAERWAAGQDLLGLGARQALALGPGAALDPAKNACPQLRTSVKVY